MVPALGGGAFVITHFETTIPKKVVKKANKKKKKAAKYFVAAKCSTKYWQFQARSTYTTPANAPGAYDGRHGHRALQAEEGEEEEEVGPLLV